MNDYGCNDTISSIVVYYGGSAKDGVTFYTDTNYIKNPVVLDVGKYTVDQLIAAGIKNDDISSIALTPGYFVTVYEHNNWEGNSRFFMISEYNLDRIGWNDTISSVEITKYGM